MTSSRCASPETLLPAIHSVTLCSPHLTRRRSGVRAMANVLRISDKPCDTRTPRRALEDGERPTTQVVVEERNRRLFDDRELRSPIRVGPQV